MKPETEESVIKSYVAPWKGSVVLACKRCQKKLRKSKKPPPFARFRKWIKAHRPKGSSKDTLKVIEVPCQKICPEKGVVVFSQAELSSQPVRFSIISNAKQMEAFFNAASGVK